VNISRLLSEWKDYPGIRRERAEKKLLKLGIKVTPKPDGKGAKVEALTADAYGLLIGEALSMTVHIGKR